VIQSPLRPGTKLSDRMGCIAKTSGYVWHRNQSDGKSFHWRILRRSSFAIVHRDAHFAFNEGFVLRESWTTGLVFERGETAGFVAKFECAKIESGVLADLGRPLGSDTEQLRYELRLGPDIALGYPPHSSLPDNIHCFDSFKCSPRALKGTIALG
jgi:hypothetical protein